MTALVQSSEPLVRVEGVSRSYRRGSEIVSAVRHASFGLWPETLSALIGPSGSGENNTAEHDRWRRAARRGAYPRSCLTGLTGVT